MATNENFSQTLVNNILNRGYTPRTPEEWIMSAIDYLHNNPTTGETVTKTEWIGNVAQSGSSAPTLTPINASASNYIGTITPSYTGVGEYTLTKTGLFTAGTFSVVIGAVPAGSAYWERVNDNSIKITVLDLAPIPADDLFNNLSILIIKFT